MARMWNISARLAVAKQPTIWRQQSNPASSKLLMWLRPFSSSTEITGTVKFYLRSKAYGFITPDSPAQAGAEEIFVHRTSIACDKSVQEFRLRPYLNKGERVRFHVESSDQKPRAVDVVFENREKVPLFRNGYLKAAIEGEKTRLGEKVLELFHSTSTLADTEFAIQVKEAAKAAEAAISIAKENQLKFGPPESYEDEDGGSKEDDEKREDP